MLPRRSRSSRKGFFSTEEHLRTAREAGADAALLLLRDLDDATVRRLLGVAAELGLDTLVEAHDAEELERAVALDAPVIGINARDLSTFRIDRAEQLRLVAGAPRDRVVVAESGIESRAQGAAAELAGADAILVGSTLMRAADPGAKLAELLSRPLVKVCGLTREEDVAAAAEAGADLAGFVLAEGSPRRAAAVLPVPGTMLSVAVVVGEADGDADLVQLYPPEEGKVRGRDAVLLRDGKEVARVVDLPWQEEDPAHLERARGRRGPRDARGRARPGERPRGDRRRAAVGGRRELEPRDRARREGPRADPRLRRGGAMTTETYGAYGGRYVPETLIPALDELEQGWAEANADPSFREELDRLGQHYVGRPSPLYETERFAPEGRRIVLKREDLNHTGAHKINNALGQILLASRLGKRRIVAETGAGQHGVATATVCARFGLECVVYMGAEDMRRQHPNVERMRLLGAEVQAVEFGTKTLKEATSEAIRDWIANVETTYYLIGSCVGPAPYPSIVRELQAVIGREARAQMLDTYDRLPDAVVACVGGGSNAIGLFAGFLDDEGVRLVGVEAAGAASLGCGPAGGAPRRALLRARRRRRSGARRALDLRGTRLPGCRAGACSASRLRPRRVRHGHRRGGARRVPSPRRDGGHPARARARSCARARPRHRRRARPGRPVRSR